MSWLICLLKGHLWTAKGKHEGDFVEMDMEWEYNERDLTCWLQGEYEIMKPEEGASDQRAMACLSAIRKG